MVECEVAVLQLLQVAQARIAGGQRHLGYGGYRYDGRWRPVAESMVRHYQLAEDARILDVGCGKGFLLYEFTQVLPRATVAGIDVSRYALEHAKEEISPQLVLGFRELQNRLRSGNQGWIVSAVADFLETAEPRLPGPSLPHDWRVTSDSIAAKSLKGA